MSGVFLPLSFAASDSEGVTVSVTVSGEEEEEAEEEEAEAEEGLLPGDNARRHTMEQDRSRILSLIQAWVARGVDVRPAAPPRPSVIPDFCTPSIGLGDIRGVQVEKPGDMIGRAEAASIVVELVGGIPSLPIEGPSFQDSNADAWHYGYIEEAARCGWVKGYGNCYGSHPCLFRPLRPLTRAEAAAIVVRFFALEPLGLAPRFSDNPMWLWFGNTEGSGVVQTAADHCVLTADRQGFIHPDIPVRRGEFVDMLRRALQGLRYGTACGQDGETHDVSERREVRFDARARSSVFASDAEQDDSGGADAAAVRLTRMSSPRAARAAVLSEEHEPWCADLSFRCFAEAVTSDARHLFASLIGRFPDGNAFRAVYPIEIALWIAGLLWLFAGIRLSVLAFLAFVRPGGR
jgi:hypothetical protein